MLKRTSQLEILKVVGSASSTFTLDDFDVDFSRNDSKVLITFKHEKGYTCDVMFNERFEYTNVSSSSNLLRAFGTDSTTRQEGYLASRYDIEVCPGEDSLHETWYVKQFNDVAASVGRWIRYLENELTVHDWAIESEAEQQGQKEKVKATITKHLEQYIDDKDARFNRSEVQEITEKLTHLVEVMKSNESLLTDEELAQLTKVIDEVSRTLATFKKGTWLEVSTNKIAQWAAGMDRVSRFIEAIERLGNVAG